MLGNDAPKVKGPMAQVLLGDGVSGVNLFRRGRLLGFFPFRFGHAPEQGPGYAGQQQQSNSQGSP